MTTETSKKTPENIANAISRYKDKHNRKPISIDFYLDNPLEKELFEYWKSMKDKKQFVKNAIQKHKLDSSNVKN